ncbi:MAG: glycosyltransferase [Thermotogota bacterium]|nr:glycosyltransferase [Thermotogota bacterium]
MKSLPDNVYRKLSDHKKPEIIVGISSYNNASTISYVAETAAKGITEFSHGSGLIVDSDGGSRDKTIDTFLSASTENVDKLAFKYDGVSGKGNAMRAIMEISKLLRTPVTIFLDADLRSVKPWWIERLSKPILRGATSYITPYYVRHKYDGTITNNLCYPLTTALYGIDIRQPIGGDFGVGLDLVDIYLSKPSEIWKSDISRFGIDIWMTITAVNESDKPPMQAALGAKIHDAKDPGKQLGPMFEQVVGTLFRLSEEYFHNWREIKGMRKAILYGEIPEVTPEPLNVDLDNMKNNTRMQLKKNQELAERLLTKDKQYIIDEVTDSGTLNIEDWVDLVYSLMIKYRKVRERTNVISLLLPLYFARVADFVEKTKELSSKEAEKYVKEAVECFMGKKPDLIKRW